MSLTSFFNELPIYLFTQFIVDDNSRTFRKSVDGFFGENLTRAYYTLKGYREISEEDYHNCENHKL